MLCALPLLRSMCLLGVVVAVPPAVEEGEPIHRLGDDVSSEDETIDVSAARLACGPRSLLVWLRLLGHSVEYNDVLQHVPIGEKGSTLAALQNGARHWTDRIKLLKAEPHDLDRLRLPLIAHGSLDSGNGHYVVVVNVTPATVTYIDGAQGVRAVVSRTDFVTRFWSGYVLIRYGMEVAMSRYLALALVARVACSGAWLWWRGSRRMAANAFLVACSIVSGCEAGSMPPHVGSAASEAGGPLAFSGNTKDLGVVRLGDSATAVFTLTNVSRRAIDLSIGLPSCGCLASRLSASHLEPGETAELALVLSRENDGNAGKLGGTNTVAVNGFDDRLLVFEATGIVEGMRLDNYSLRLPDDLDGFSPEPVRGEIVLGAEHSDAQVQIVDVVVNDGHGLIGVGAPVLGEVETLETHLRRRFYIPVTLTAGGGLVSDVARLTVVYRIDDRTADGYLNLLVFPKARTSPP